MTYLVTFVCYGAHLPGEEGTIDRKHNQLGSPALPADAGRLALTRRLMDQRPYAFDHPCRDVVLASIIERCAQRGWHLYAAHVRSNHVHVILDTEADPQRVMNDVKAYASRCLNQAGFDTPDRKRWARHGSTRKLYDRASIDAAIRYVIQEQGDPMSTFVTKDQR